MFKVKIPGSLMLFGEHSVLHNHQAISAAINRYVYAEAEETNDGKVIIETDKFGNYSSALDKLVIEKPFDFVLSAVNLYADKLKGIKIKIKSEFSSSLGFGSSAAVTAAVLSCVYLALNKELDKEKLYEDCVGIIRKIQGFGSGADAAASIHGGVLLLDGMERLSSIMPLTVVYSGLKESTVKVVNIVNDKFKNNEEVLHKIYEVAEVLIKKAAQHIRDQNWMELGKLFDISSGLHESLGLYNQVLYDITSSLREIPSVFGAKISGSGLGDCVIGIGNTSMHHLFPVSHYQRLNQVRGIDISVSATGIEQISEKTHV